MSVHKIVIIVGSSRSDGDTVLVAKELSQMEGWPVIDLQEYSFTEFDYTHANRDDDFIKLMKMIIQNYDNIVFATPVYWYSMSARMKMFFDRLSDLLKIEKDLGRQLRGKGMAALSCSATDDQGDYFWQPFIKSASYLGMQYLDDVHVVVVNQHLTELTKNRLSKFSKSLKRNL